MNDKSSENIPLLIMAGPTAVGKSALALELATKLKTDIISADSAQVYRSLNIGTAKPTAKEQKYVKHHLINLVNPDQHFSVADYQKLAAPTIKLLHQQGKMPFMVGGTGLYIRAVTDYYAFGKKGGDPTLRKELEFRAANDGIIKLYEALQRVDPAAAAKIHPHDQRRIIRALEVYELEGKPISIQNVETRLRSSPYKTLFFGLNMERALLYERIENRVDQMIADGFLEEVEGLRGRGYTKEDPGMQILGYRQLMGYLEGHLDWEMTVAEIKKQTRNLAKRQLTWFRREKNIRWIDVLETGSVETIIENIYRKVQDLIPPRANI